MQLNKIHSVKTVDRVAAELGETVDRLHDLAIGMEPEDGIIWVYGPTDVEILAFTPFGVENLIEMIAAHRDRKPRTTTVFTGWILIIYWNTKYLRQAVTGRRRAGLDCSPDLLAHISPLGWSHIMLTREARWPRRA